MMLRGLVVLALSFVTSLARAQTTPPDVVYLTNGGVLRGTIVENIPGDHLSVQLATGELRTFAAAEIRSLALAEATPPVAVAPVALTAPTPDDRVPLHVRATSPGLTVHLLTSTGTLRTVLLGSVTGAGATVVDNFRPLCTAPCDVRLHPGDYTLGISVPHSNARRADSGGSLRLTQETTVVAEYTDRAGLRTAGWWILGLGAVAGLAFVLAGEALGSPGTAYPVYSPRQADLGILVAGLVTVVVASVVGFILVFLQDHAELHQR